MGSLKVEDRNILTYLLNLMFMKRYVGLLYPINPKYKNIILISIVKNP